MNPWLKIPLEEYEAHMAMSEVGQAQLISDVFADSIRKYSPASLAVLGCAGGNGLERIQPGSQIRVTAIDINPGYIACAKNRYIRNYHSSILTIKSTKTIGGESFKSTMYQCWKWSD